MVRSNDKDESKLPDTIPLWLVAGTCYFLLAVSTIHLTSDGSAIATVWPANAVLVALLLLGHAPRWITVLSAGLAGNLAANWIARGSLSGPLLYSFANGIEIVVAVLLIRADPRPDLAGSVGRLFRFVAAAGVVAPFASSLLGSATALIVYQQPFATAFTTWLMSDSLGLLIFTPVFVSIFNGDFLACFARKTVAKRAEAMALMAMTAALTWAVFFMASLPAIFMLYPPIMLVTFRIGSLGTKMAVVIVAVIGAYATATGHGPLVMMTADAGAQAHMFQASLAIMLLTCLPVAAEIEERNRLAAELAARERDAMAEALTDPLTSVLNRRGFERSATAALAQPGVRPSIVAIDVDRFKQINDRWGHAFGDEVLQHIASQLRAHTRPGDLIGRWGGDEFTMLLQGCDGSSAEMICARVQAALRATPISPDAKTDVMIAISCGATRTRAGEELAEAHARADAALYEAKAEGRNTVRLARIA